MTRQIDLFEGSGGVAPPELVRIAQSAEALVDPPLHLLRSVYLGVQNGLRARRRDLLQQREDARREGYEAATRLMLEDRAARGELAGPTSYFEQARQLKIEGNGGARQSVDLIPRSGEKA